MGFSFDINLPTLTVFLQGILSFFSPCVLPLLPIYIGYLSGGTGTQGTDGKMYYKKSKVMLHTLCFIIGISFAFVLLGLAVSTFASFFKEHQLMFAKAGGILIILFGLYQLGLFGNSQLLSTEKRLPIKINVLAMSPFMAFLLGFTFSFAWTPCVGPTLASVLLMTASATTTWTGLTLIGVYTLGFVIPFLAVGLFTTSVLQFFKEHISIVKYTVKIGGILMILIGVLMFTGKMNTVTSYLSETPQTTPPTTSSAPPPPTKQPIKAIDFELYEQYGKKHTLAEYKGKVVFLNFWATWCPPCRAEMPDIQKLYTEYGNNSDVVILGVAAPNFGNETDEAGIKKFLDQHGYTYPVLMDKGALISMQYDINAYPTTFMIDKEGNIFGYVTGQLSEDMMRSIIRQTLSGKK